MIIPDHSRLFDNIPHIRSSAIHAPNAIIYRAHDRAVKLLGLKGDSFKGDGMFARVACSEQDRQFGCRALPAP